jgi:prepilin-type N-terminal cleavage/methylation domain-containing protein
MRSDSFNSEKGFSLIEVIISMFLLGIIAVAILPALWSGITNASRQSDTASATRQLNALVETARDRAAGGSCEGVIAAAALHRYRAGIDVGATASNYDVQTAGPSGYSCTVGATNDLTLVATDQSGVNLASLTATIFVTAG